MPKAPTRRAYSYIRFSSLLQADGGSLKRQLDLTRDYCKRKGLILDESLTLQDLGVSAFRGDNVKEGALAGYLEACRMGRVARGSVLIVESLDRLSRDQIRPALQLFLALQDLGVTLVTLQPEREYLPEATDSLALIEPLIVFARAHEESAMKSHRSRHSWKEARDKARQGGGPIMKTCPAWLEVTEDGFRIREKAAAVIRQIYAMARDGLGIHRITERLNDKKDKKTGKVIRKGTAPITNGRRWAKAYVYRILTNPAAMGSYQPRRQEGKKMVIDGAPIPNHYPPVVSEADWQEVQSAIMSRDGGFELGGRGSPAAGRKGKDDSEANLFTGLLRSARTGEKMQIVHALGRKGGGERKRYVYLCSSLETGNCTGARIDFKVFEDAVLSRLRELTPADIAGEGEPANEREAEIARLSGRVLDIDERLRRANERARTAGNYDAFLDLIEGLHNERKEAIDRRKELEEENAGRPAADLGETHTLIDLLARTPPEQLPDVRRRLKTRLRLLVSEVWALIVPRVGKSRLCAIQMHFRGGQCRRYIVYHQPGKSYGKGRIEGNWWARTLTKTAGPDELDMRNKKHAAALEAELLACDLNKLTGE